ncbi:MAG: hypothetical protein IPP74_11080 [Alphaproteobacteria bacterium]|nr:hypothetical protein [Alphaproteobacteria bacterium]
MPHSDNKNPNPAPNVEPTFSANSSNPALGRGLVNYSDLIDSVKTSPSGRLLASTGVMAGVQIASAPVYTVFQNIFTTAINKGLGPVSSFNHLIHEGGLAGTMKGWKHNAQKLARKSYRGPAFGFIGTDEPIKLILTLSLFDTLLYSIPEAKAIYALKHHNDAAFYRNLTAEHGWKYFASTHLRSVPFTFAQYFLPWGMFVMVDKKYDQWANVAQPTLGSSLQKAAVLAPLEVLLTFHIVYAKTRLHDHPLDGVQKPPSYLEILRQTFSRNSYKEFGRSAPALFPRILWAAITNYTAKQLCMNVVGNPNTLHKQPIDNEKLPTVAPIQTPPASSTHAEKIIASQSQHFPKER